MKKRTFIKLSSAFMSGTLLAPLVDWSQEEKLRNWAGNYIYSTNRLFNAKSVEEVQGLVKKFGKLKVLGTRHCFNGIADSKDNFVSVVQFNKDISIDRAANTVTVAAGIRYGELATYLNDHGFALHNLASLPHISVAGACATATHGSGSNNGNLATAVTALEMVTATGDIVKLSAAKDPELFAGAVVGLGGLGVVTKLTLAIQPAFMVRQDVFENLPLQQLAGNFDAIMAAGYSVSLFTDWSNGNFSEVWVKSRIDQGLKSEYKTDFFGAKPATKNLHPIVALSAENCTEQMGVPGPWQERLPHFRMGFTPSSGKELQSEFFIPRDKSYEAILAIEQLQEKITPHLLITEIRTIAADDLWMSPCYKQPSTTIHFTWKPDWPAVSRILPLIEARLAPFNARPHWGKLFTMSPGHLKSLYTKLPDFLGLLKRYDPNGKFRNDFLNKNIYSS